MDKEMAKRLFAAAGIPCPEGRVMDAAEYNASARRGDPVMPPPYVVKPVNEGSSVGVHIVMEGDNYLPGDDWTFGERLLVEAFITGRAQIGRANVCTPVTNEQLV